MRTWVAVIANAVDLREVIVIFAARAVSYLMPICWISLAVVLLILLPLSLVKKIRHVTGPIIYALSYIYGITTWFVGTIATFATLGTIWLIIGLVLIGLGVVPLGIIGAFISNNAALGLVIIVLLVITFICRFVGLLISESTNKEN